MFVKYRLVCVFYFGLIVEDVQLLLRVDCDYMYGILGRCALTFCLDYDFLIYFIICLNVLW